MTDARAFADLVADSHLGVEMTSNEEEEMHALAVRLAQLTEGVGWEALRYLAIARCMEQLATYCATCDCQRPPLEMLSEERPS